MKQMVFSTSVEVDKSVAGYDRESGAGIILLGAAYPSCDPVPTSYLIRDPKTQPRRSSTEDFRKDDPYFETLPKILFKNSLAKLS